MRLDSAAHRAALAQIAVAAAARGLVVAPVGSTYFLFRGRPTLMTKDVDAVVHAPSLSVASLEHLVALGRDLGEVEIGNDEATVRVIMQGQDGPTPVDLVRGKRARKDGFFPRTLLEEAARRGETQGGLLLYPIEYVLVLKADAAVDRASQSAGERRAQNAARAAAFRQDVFDQMGAAYASGSGLREDWLRDALMHVKESRQDGVAALLEPHPVASFGSARLRPSEARPRHRRAGPSRPARAPAGRPRPAPRRPPSRLRRQTGRPRRSTPRTWRRPRRRRRP